MTEEELKDLAKASYELGTYNAIKAYADRVASPIVRSLKKP